MTNTWTRPYDNELLRRYLRVFTVEWIDEPIHQAAVSGLLAATRRKLSLVDCTSFEVMRRIGVRKAFVFDPHFKEQGFTCVP